MDSQRLNDRDGEKWEGEEYPAFRITKPIDLDTLGKELAEAHGWDSVPGIISEGKASIASEKTPVVVWIMDEGVDTNKVKSVVSNHEIPADKYGAFVAKAVSGEDFTDEEIQEALRHILLRLR